MMIPTTGASLTAAAYFARDFFTSSADDRAGGLAQLGVLLVGVGDPVEDLDRVALRRAVAQADDREPPDRDVRVARGELVEQRAERVDVAGVVPREALERDERRSARGRALVLEAAAQQLELLPEPELRDRPVRLSARRGSRRRGRAASISSSHCERSCASARSSPACASASASAAASASVTKPTGERARRWTDVPRRRPEQPPGSLLLEDVRRPAGDARAREHRRRERRRDLGDVEHERRVVLDVRLQRPLGMAPLELRQRSLLELLGDSRSAVSRARAPFA